LKAVLEFDFVIKKRTCKKMASDKNHRPCLPLKPQEKVLFPAKKVIVQLNNYYKTNALIINYYKYWREVF